MEPTSRILVVSRVLAVIVTLTLTVSAAVLMSCSEENDLLEPSIAISGRVTDNSGQSGDVYVEVSRSKRTKVNPNGSYVLPVHKDYYIDSLYAYVDVSGNQQYDQNEPYGFLHSSSNHALAQPIHVRDQSVPNVNIEIPFWP
jgi:hypothetical protein